MCRAQTASGVAPTCNPNDMRWARIPATPEAWLTASLQAGSLQAGPLHAGGAPDREPPGQVLLPLQVVADHALDLQFERVVPALAGQRGERVERAPLVQVDEGEAALLIVGEGDQGTQQLRAEAVVDQRGVDRVQVGDQRLELV